MTQWGLDNLFNPGKRHMDDEKRRLQSTREEIGDNSGGRRIDLDGGTVSISVRRGAAPEPSDADAAQAVAEDIADPAPERALDPALEAEEVPAVALASDEAEIAPAVVDDTVAATVEAPADEEPIGAAPAAAAEPEPEPEPAPEPEAAPAPQPPAARPAATLSARAWARRG